MNDPRRREALTGPDVSKLDGPPRDGGGPVRPSDGQTATRRINSRLGRRALRLDLARAGRDQTETSFDQCDVADEHDWYADYDDECENDAIRVI